MRNQTEILIDGMNALIDKIGVFEAEVFVSKMQERKFDYTIWQRKLYNHFSLVF